MALRAAPPCAGTADTCAQPGAAVPRQPRVASLVLATLAHAGAGRAVLGRPDGGQPSSRPAPTSSPGCRASPGGAGSRSRPAGCCSPRRSWGGAVSALVTWWAGPDNALHRDAFHPGRFDVTGIVPVAYAVFAMALGICAGALLRRTLPAMAVTLAGFIAVRVAVIALWLRPHYLSAVTVYYKLTATAPADRVLLAVSQGIVRPERPADGGAAPAGRLTGSTVSYLPGLMRASAGQPLTEPTSSCRAALTATAGTSPTSPPAGSGPSRASRPASSWSSPPSCWP